MKTKEREKKMKRDIKKNEILKQEDCEL